MKRCIFASCAALTVALLFWIVWRPAVAVGPENLYALGLYFTDCGNVASASSITVDDCNYATLTGSTTVNTIDTCDSETAGRVLWLQCGAATATLSEAGNMDLGGSSIVCGTDAELVMLLCDGTTWYGAGQFPGPGPDFTTDVTTTGDFLADGCTYVGDAGGTDGLGFCVATVGNCTSPTARCSVNADCYEGSCSIGFQACHADTDCKNGTCTDNSTPCYDDSDCGAYTCGVCSNLSGPPGEACAEDIDCSGYPTDYCLAGGGDTGEVCTDGGTCTADAEKVAFVDLDGDTALDDGEEIGTLDRVLASDARAGWGDLHGTQTMTMDASGLVFDFDPYPGITTGTGVVQFSDTVAKFTATSAGSPTFATAVEGSPYIQATNPIGSDNEDRLNIVQKTSPSGTTLACYFEDAGLNCPNGALEGSEIVSKYLHAYLSSPSLTQTPVGGSLQASGATAGNAFMVLGQFDYDQTQDVTKFLQTWDDLGGIYAGDTGDTEMNPSYDVRTMPSADSQSSQALIWKNSTLAVDVPNGILTGGEMCETFSRAAAPPGWSADTLVGYYDTVSSSDTGMEMPCDGSLTRISGSVYVYTHNSTATIDAECWLDGASAWTVSISVSGTGLAGADDFQDRGTTTFTAGQNLIGNLDFDAAGSPDDVVFGTVTCCWLCDRDW